MKQKLLWFNLRYDLLKFFPPFKTRESNRTRKREVGGGMNSGDGSLVGGFRSTGPKEEEGELTFQLSHRT